MAFANRVGSLLKQATTSSPTLYQAIRCMSSSKVFVGGLSYTTDDQSLQEAFANYGQVTEARIILDRETGRSRGFGFVTYTSSEEASAAITALDGKDLHGRNIRVNYATERTGGPRGGFGGGGGYGGGGYGGGSYGGGGYGGGGGGYGGGGYGGGSGGYGGGGYGSGGGDSSGGYGNTGAGGGYSSGYAASGGGGSSDNFASGSFTGGNPTGNLGSAGGGDEFLSSAPGDNFGANSGGQNDIADDLFKDDDNYANKRG